MPLPFLDRHCEQRRLQSAFAAREGTFCCVYGRRRCGRVAPAGRIDAGRVEPNRSRLEIGALESVHRQVAAAYAQHLGSIWEEMVRQAIPRLKLGNREWLPAQRWWGTDLQGEPGEIDAVAASADGAALLVAEAKWAIGPADADRLLRQLRDRLACLPIAQGYAQVLPLLFAVQVAQPTPSADILTAEQVLPALV